MQYQPFNRLEILLSRSAGFIAFCALLFLLGGTGTGQAADSWPDYRGPWGDGYAAAKGDDKAYGVPTKWSETENVRWKTEIPHLGLSSPVVMDNRVWLTTATEDGHDFWVICVDAESGDVLANKKVFHSDNPQSLGNGSKDNSYATCSAVLEKGRAYVHFGSFGTACLDAESFEVIWKRDDLPCWHYRGASSSPVLFKDLLILTFDGADHQYHTALNKVTGATVWKTDRSAIWNDEHIENKMVQDGDSVRDTARLWWWMWMINRRCSVSEPRPRMDMILPLEPNFGVWIIRRIRRRPGLYFSRTTQSLSPGSAVERRCVR